MGGLKTGRGYPRLIPIRPGMGTGLILAGSGSVMMTGVFSSGSNWGRRYLFSPVINWPSTWIRIMTLQPATRLMESGPISKGVLVIGPAGSTTRVVISRLMPMTWDWQPRPLLHHRSLRLNSLLLSEKVSDQPYSLENRSGGSSGMKGAYPVTLLRIPAPERRTFLKRGGFLLIK